MFMNYSKKYSKLIYLLIFIIVTQCGLYKKGAVDYRKEPAQATDRARKNVEEGRGISLKNLTNRKTSYEFSTSNSMWRASLELLDFLPLSTVDYSGGLIISDWYSDNNDASNESIKITLRFLSNEIRSDSLKIIVHQKICDKNNICQTNLIESKIAEELARSILTKAATLEKQKK
jgi:hypothetical protein